MGGKLAQPSVNRWFLGFSGWWRGPESNWRHYDFQSYALPTELPRHSRKVEGTSHPARPDKAAIIPYESAGPKGRPGRSTSLYGGGFGVADDFQSYALPTELPRHSRRVEGTSRPARPDKAAIIPYESAGPKGPTWLARRPRYTAAASASRPRPSSRRTRSSIVLQMSGLSLRNCLAFSRP